MLQSKLFTKTLREAPKDEEALNAKLLIRAGFVHKTMAGVYSFLPLGLKVLSKIENIVRDEMNQAGGQEILMSSLEPKENWQKTGRWDAFDALFKLESRFGGEYALGPTHEELIVPIAQSYTFSYKDLPFGAYQLQTKFRDEKRPKSGLLRGREFRMKDLYSFHANEENLVSYYEAMKQSYANVFSRTGLKAILVEASGGSFSKLSHEFQVLSETGEDTIYFCACGFARNKEIAAELEEGSPCPNCGEKLQKAGGIEVGNIFRLNTKFSEPFGLKYKDAAGAENLVYMGCYGIGTSRLMGAVAEVLNDDKGLLWPESVAPFRIHLIELGEGLGKQAYEDLQAAGIEVLYDEREASAGTKFQDADLIGIPYRLVASEKTGDKVEIKRRSEKESQIMDIDEAIKLINGNLR